MRSVYGENSDFGRRNILRERVSFSPFHSKSLCKRREGNPVCREPLLPPQCGGGANKELGETPHRKCIPVCSRGDSVGRGTSVLGAGENTRWHIQCVGFFGKRLSLGLIKCSDKNQSFIKVCSHSGSARPRSWNVSWKPASLAEECCLSYLIRRSCCERA